ncbi:PREDICTED: uncharacterized protein LOC101304996 [Fragaria vesca subsp. vesca]|uniref:uncharacterized protein LOC101304996 n=1 Tax=Fragaria vesca subsp. vesca TaxID=101020 RepID=UPI0002C2F6B2|nr:PREDICTED: uncharacterized protein LOC101304996 [Fragaria vesca subsp. vesca]
MTLILKAMFDTSCMNSSQGKVPSQPLKSLKMSMMLRDYDVQNSHDSSYLMPIDLCEKHEDEHVLIFPKLMRPFGIWVKEHAEGEVTDADMWVLLKKIGQSMRYLSSKRAHGNLRRGIGVTAQVGSYFFNLGDARHSGRYCKDFKELHRLLRRILPSLADPSIKRKVEMWATFLSESCLQDSACRNPNHVRLIANYPSSCDIDEHLQFLANMNSLCSIKYMEGNLLRNRAFKKHLMGFYSQWNQCFISGQNTGGLNLVYQHGRRRGKYVDRSGILCVPSIVIFAQSAIERYMQRAEKYNIKHKSENPQHPDHINPYLLSSEILAELEIEFPHLIENIYGAYYKAVAKGYKHTS